MMRLNPVPGWHKFDQIGWYRWQNDIGLRVGQLNERTDYFIRAWSMKTADLPLLFSQDGFATVKQAKAAGDKWLKDNGDSAALSPAPRDDGSP